MKLEYLLTITGILILNRCFCSGIDRKCEISYKFYQVISRENCLPLLIMSELKILVYYQKHSDNFRSDKLHCDKLNSDKFRSGLNRMCEISYKFCQVLSRENC